MPAPVSMELHILACMSVCVCVCVTYVPNAQIRLVNSQI